MQNANVNVDEICKVVNWYQNLSKDYTNISSLMHARKTLSTYLFGLSTEMSNLRQIWKQNEFETESARRKIMVEMIDENVAVSKANEYCRMKIISFVELENLSENEYHKLKFFIDSANDVNSTLMQHISLLKKEQEILNNGGFV